MRVLGRGELVVRGEGAADAVVGGAAGGDLDGAAGEHDVLPVWGG